MASEEARRLFNSRKPIDPKQIDVIDSRGKEENIFFEHQTGPFCQIHAINNALGQKLLCPNTINRWAIEKAQAEPNYFNLSEEQQEDVKIKYNYNPFWNVKGQEKGPPYEEVVLGATGQPVLKPDGTPLTETKYKYNYKTGPLRDMLMQKYKINVQLADVMLPNKKYWLIFPKSAKTQAGHAVGVRNGRVFDSNMHPMQQQAHRALSGDEFTPENYKVASLFHIPEYNTKQLEARYGSATSAFELALPTEKIDYQRNIMPGRSSLTSPKLYNIYEEIKGFKPEKEKIFNKTKFLKPDQARYFKRKNMESEPLDFWYEDDQKYITPKRVRKKDDRSSQDRILDNILDQYLLTPDEYLFTPKEEHMNLMEPKTKF